MRRQGHRTALREPEHPLPEMSPLQSAVPSSGVQCVKAAATQRVQLTHTHSNWTEQCSSLSANWNWEEVKFCFSLNWLCNTDHHELRFPVTLTSMSHRTVVLPDYWAITYSGILYFMVMSTLLLYYYFSLFILGP